MGLQRVGHNWVTFTFWRSTVGNKSFYLPQMGHGKDTNSSWINKQINVCCSFLAPLSWVFIEDNSKAKDRSSGPMTLTPHSWPTRSVKKRGRKWEKAADSFRCCLGSEERAGRRERAQKGQACLYQVAPAETDQGCLGNLLHTWISRSPEGPEKSKCYCLLQFVYGDYSEWEDQVLIKGLLPDSSWESREDQEDQVKAEPGRNYCVSMGPSQLSALPRLKMY